MTAVSDFSLEVDDGSFVVLLGPSGCGKTTLLRIIAGLIPQDKGNVCFGAKIVNELSPRNRNVSMVFQNYALYPHMSVYDNIAFPLKLKKVPKEEIRKRVHEKADLLGIRELLDRKPREISGGQQQRVALGRALVKEPDVFLMDEPLSNLDAKLRVMMRAEIKRLQRKLRVTTVYVTHDQVEAMTMADRIALMSGGKLQQFSEPDSLYQHPRNMFVAGFIGSPPMNLLDCSLITKDGRDIISDGGFQIEIPQDLGKRARDSANPDELTLGIRPRDIQVHLERAPGSVESEIYVGEPLGDEVILNLRLRGETKDEIVKAIFSGSCPPKLGDRVWLDVKPECVHLFDRRTGSSIV